MSKISRPRRGVSIHAPREGCDANAQSLSNMRERFNSRTPGGVRHSLVRQPLPLVPSFNSRTPGGVRLGRTSRLSTRRWFQFTHPGRGATIGGGQAKLEDLVSIHAPREGCDLTRVDGKFLPAVSIHAPREGCDNQHGENLENEAEFQFTHPGRGATRVECADIEELRRFQFTHPGRGATQPYIVSGLLT